MGRDQTAAFATEQGPGRILSGRPLVRYAVWMLLFALAYALYGLKMGVGTEIVSPFWRPTGIAFAVLLLGGLHWWPGVVFGTILVALYQGLDATQTSVYVLGGLAAPLLGAFLLQRASVQPSLKRTQDVLTFVLQGALLPSLLSSGILFFGSLLTSHTASRLGVDEWFSLWLGDVDGILVDGTFLLSCWSMRRKLHVFMERSFEFIAFMVGAVGAGILLARGVPHVLILGLAFGAVRFGTFGAASANLVSVSTATLTVIYMGEGAFPGRTVLNGLLDFGGLVAVLSLLALFLAAAMHEREALMRALRETLHGMEEAVRRSTDDLRQANVRLEQEMEELARARQEREKLLVRVEQQSQELEEVVRAAGHDLRAPLLNVRGFSHMVEEGVDAIVAQIRSGAPPEAVLARMEEDIRSPLKFIASGTGKMEALIGALVRVSRAGRSDLHCEHVDVAVVVRKVVEQTQFQIRTAGAEVVLLDLPACQGDPALLDQVFANLIDNALKYRHPDRLPLIQVSGRQEKDRVVYAVSDNGKGIPADRLESVWGLFRRLDPQSGIPGDGVGLTLVRSLVTRMGGRAWVESRPGEGSRFLLDLPASV